MSTATLDKPMTTAELLAIPADGIDRWLIRGELRERPMTIRNFLHTSCSAVISHYLVEWLLSQPLPRGRVLTGDAGVRLPGDPESTFGVDLLYLDTELNATLGRHSMIVEGVPTLAVEILSPSNTQEELWEKRDVMLAVGVKLIWFVDPTGQTILVQRPDAKPQLFHNEQVLTAEPHLPGFRVEVSKLFE